MLQYIIKIACTYLVVVFHLSHLFLASRTKIFARYSLEVWKCSSKARTNLIIFTIVLLLRHSNSCLTGVDGTTCHPPRSSILNHIILQGRSFFSSIWEKTFLYMTSGVIVVFIQDLYYHIYIYIHKLLLCRISITNFARQQQQQQHKSYDSISIC